MLYYLVRRVDLNFTQECVMKENCIIAAKPHNAFLVFSYDCIPDKAVWDEEKQLDAPYWEKPPCWFRTLFSKVLKARKMAMEIARQDGISFMAYTWEVDDTHSEE